MHYIMRRTGTPASRLRPHGDDFTATRRNLPHWEMGGATYFVTFRTLGVALPRAVRSEVLAAFRYFDGERYTLWAAVVMPDHAHLLLMPRRTASGECWSLAQILHSLKSYTANEINRVLGRRGTAWLDERFDRIVRDRAELSEKWQYIRNNPVKAGLCTRPEEWDALYESAVFPW
jgi:REP element-mobilizing transposase RayT